MASDPQRPLTAPLLMDRSEPLGNSVDNLDRHALHVKALNLVAEALATKGAKQTPLTFTQAMGASGTEQTITFPNGLVAFELRLRTLGTLQYAWSENDSDTDTIFKTIEKGVFLNVERLSAINDLKIYIQCIDRNNPILEIETWTNL